MLDGRQIRIPDALRLITLKLHATRNPARRTTETDWQEIAGLLHASNRNLEDPELRAIISQYGGAGALTEIQRRVINTSLACENPDWLNLPTPREPLRPWTEQEIEPGVMIAVMEAVMPFTFWKTPMTNA